MSRVVFVQNDVFAKPAIMALSAIAKREGHVCDVVVTDLERDPVKTVSFMRPDIIAFSITTSEFPFLRSIGPDLRKACGDALIICGGSHATFYPEVIKEHYLDAVCIGEGDLAFADYLNAVDSHKKTVSIPNFLVKTRGSIHRNDVRPLVCDLDDLPYYDRNIYGRYALYTGKGREILYHQVVMTGRGCPKSCSFCFNKCYNRMYRGKGKIVRRRSVDHIMNELKLMKRSGKLRFITFDDDNFTLAPKQWLHRFFEAYDREIGIPFKINSTPDALDEDLVQLLKRAGCHSVKMGIESGNEEMRNRILCKNLNEVNIVSAANLLKKYGIRFQTFNMVCCPDETLSMAMETYVLNRKIRPDFVWCSLLNPYPGTEIYDFCLKRNVIPAVPDHGDTSHSYFTGSPVNNADKKELLNLQKLMNTAVQMNIPTPMLRFLVKLPLAGLFKFVFGVSMTLGLIRINKNSLGSIIYLSFRYLSRYNKD